MKSLGLYFAGHKKNLLCQHI